MYKVNIIVPCGRHWLLGSPISVPNLLTWKSFVFNFYLLKII